MKTPEDPVITLARQYTAQKLEARWEQTRKEPDSLSNQQVLERISALFGADITEFIYYIKNPELKIRIGSDLTAYRQLIKRQ